MTEEGFGLADVVVPHHTVSGHHAVLCTTVRCVTTLRCACMVLPALRAFSLSEAGSRRSVLDGEHLGEMRRATRRR